MSATPFKIMHLPHTDSTNHWLAENGSADDTAVWTDYQTAGRGCGQNTWESETGKNLLFSMLIHPKQMKAAQQFTISMAIALAIVKTLEDMGIDKLSIKWPNDIYWQDRKLAGILIENRLAGAMVKESIIGVGLNVNQTVFRSDAPNPVSLRQIIGRTLSREAVLHTILHNFTLDMDAADYRKRLYRRHGFHPYRDKDGLFEGELMKVDDDGHLVLRDRENGIRRYAFKEVSYIIYNPNQNNHGKIQENPTEAVGREPDGQTGSWH